MFKKVPHLDHKLLKAKPKQATGEAACREKRGCKPEKKK